MQVRRLREDDAGLYQCQAVNVVGQSETRSIDVVVVPRKSINPKYSVSYCHLSLLVAPWLLWKCLMCAIKLADNKLFE